MIAEDHWEARAPSDHLATRVPWGARVEHFEIANSLTINRGNAADTLIVNALPDFNAGLTIGTAANTFSTITFAGGVTLAANKNLSGDTTSILTMTAEVFVDSLLRTAQQSSGVDLSSERGNLVNLYNSSANASESRSLVLRSVVEGSKFKQTQYNSAFVLMEYFGYLGRNPDRTGYDF